SDELPMDILPEYAIIGGLELRFPTTLSLSDRSQLNDRQGDLPLEIMPKKQRSEKQEMFQEKQERNSRSKTRRANAEKLCALDDINLMNTNMNPECSSSVSQDPVVEDPGSDPPLELQHQHEMGSAQTGSRISPGAPVCSSVPHLQTELLVVSI
ncbi:hypothetical protein DNTS_012334, partial [Danionella cerebrum]